MEAKFNTDKIRYEIRTEDGLLLSILNDNQLLALILRCKEGNEVDIR